jgi:hypothetical protein
MFMFCFHSFFQGDLHKYVAVMTDSSDGLNSHVSKYFEADEALNELVSNCSVALATKLFLFSSNWRASL